MSARESMGSSLGNFLSRRVSGWSTLATLTGSFLGLLLLPDLRAATGARVIESLIYSGVCCWMFHALTQRNLLRVTLIYLALPYFLFAAGWLKPAVAAVLAGVLLVSLVRALRLPPPPPSSPPEETTLRSLLCFVAILVWVHLSGVGGYGYQTDDYQMHNSRLLDLVERPWPVRYGDDKNLVFYLAWYMPAAVVGKLSGYAIAQNTIYLWTILGVWQALLWLARLTGRRLSTGLALCFALFGALDIIGYWYSVHLVAPNGGQPLVPADLDFLCFWTSYAFQFMVGNYLSTTFQLYWAPHQIIAGWLAIAVVTSLFWQRRSESIVFAFSLLFFWSPMIAVGLLPYLAILVCTSLHPRWRDVFSLQNVIAPAVLLFVFVLFYVGGSAAANPMIWTPSRITLKQFDLMLLLYALGWAAYFAVITPTLRQFSTPQRVSMFALTVNLFLVSLVAYGAYSDLFCRTSAPLMFLLLTYLIMAVKHYRPALRAFLLFAFVLLSAGSSLHQLTTSIRRYGETQLPISIPAYAYAYENLGPDSSFFARHLRK